MPAEHELRRQRVRQVCSWHGDALKGKELKKIPSGENSVYVLDRERGMLFCGHPKVGSSTWLTYFARLANESLTDQTVLGKIHKTVPLLFSLEEQNITSFSGLESLIEQEEDLLTFSFVRHPFDRLVSAFEDKIKYRNDKDFYNLSDQLNGSFPGFVDHVIREFTKRCDYDVVGSDCSAVNGHWRRYTDRCDYCNVDFDVIGHQETFDQDTRFILESRGLQRLLQSSSGNKVIRKNSVFHDSSRTAEYMGQLDEEALKKLKEVYKIDFQMFGYNDSYYL